MNMTKVLNLIIFMNTIVKNSDMLKKKNFSVRSEVYYIKIRD